MFDLNENLREKFQFEIWKYNQTNSYHEESLTIEKLTFDTRKLDPNDFFIALKDQRDGHNFIFDAYTKGAKGVIIEYAYKNNFLDIVPSIDHDFWVVYVPNTMNFLQEMANFQRHTLNAKVVTVLGSNGKTSTKEFLFQMFQFFEKKVYSSLGNFNNSIGLPISILNAPLETKILILEMGMNHPDEIRFLTKISEPNWAVMTSIGREHLEFFKDELDVAKAELEILEGLKEGSYFFYPLYAPLVDYVQEYCKEKQIHLNLFALDEFQNQEERIHPQIKKQIAKLEKQKIYWKNWILENPNILHLGMLSNFFLSFLVTYEFFLPNSQKEILPFLEFITCIQVLSKQRFEMFLWKNTWIIDDTYNANPDSFLIAIESLRNLFPTEKLGCFAGHMAELGHYSKLGHKTVGEALQKHSIELLGLCGEKDVLYMMDGYGSSVPYFESSEQLANELHKQNLTFLDEYKAILIKGSRSAKMETITALFRNSYA